jgi:acyl-CoA oxidase
MSHRVSVLQGHFAPLGATNLDTDMMNETLANGLDTQELYRWLVRDNREMREAIFAFLRDPLYAPNYSLSLSGFRELTSQRVGKFVAQRFFSVSDYLASPLKFQAALESLSFCDYSLAIKSGVHFTLCGGTIAKLGTEYHHREFLPKMDTLELPGCFAMTELGRGSNVLGIETTAVYDATTQEFVINTPTNSASKFWIGGAANTAKITTCFAQLTINGTWQGPHVFVVRLRDDNGNLMPGVRCADNGPKMGLNGVDNGQIWFNNVRIPRANLLNRYAQVDANGRYSSSIPSPTQRFGTMIGGLTTGRMLIAQGAIDASKIGVSIAIRYGANRPQFGDTTIIEYVTHQRRLLPALATTYALHLSMIRCKNLALAGSGNGNGNSSGLSAAEIGKQVHVLSSGLKAAATWHRTQILQDCRECCGGLGVMSANRIGPMLNDMNVDVTFEGDNTVMMQQVAKPLVEAALSSKTISPPLAPRINPLDLGPGCVGALLQWRVQSITAEVAGNVAAAAARSGANGKAAAAAALEASMDRLIALGWAAVDASSYETFIDEIKSAPVAWRNSLAQLALLYGLSRVEKGMTDYLVGGALPATAVGPLRLKINFICAGMVKDGAKSAVALCDAWGIPDHLLQAPIALRDWRGI